MFKATLQENLKNDASYREMYAFIY